MENRKFHEGERLSPARQLEREGLPNGVHRGSLSHYGALAERKARYRLPAPHLRAIRFYIPRAPPRHRAPEIICLRSNQHFADK